MQVLRTVLLITGIGLWNTWQGKIKVSCEDRTRRALEHFGAVKCFGRTECKVCHCSSHLLPRTRQLRDRQWWRVTLFHVLRPAKKQAICDPLPQLSRALTWLSAPDRTEKSAHPSSPASTLTPPLPSSAPRQHIQDMHTYTPWLLWSFSLLVWVSSNAPAKYESRALIS